MAILLKHNKVCSLSSWLNREKRLKLRWDNQDWWEKNLCSVAVLIRCWGWVVSLTALIMHCVPVQTDRISPLQVSLELSGLAGSTAALLRGPQGKCIQHQVSFPTSAQHGTAVEVTGRLLKKIFKECAAAQHRTGQNASQFCVLLKDSSENWKKK